MGDQPEAIAQLVEGVKNGVPAQTLLGVTGSGKTFTMANVIKEIKRPVQCTFLICYQASIAQDICTIEIYGNICHERHTMNSRPLFTFEITQKIDAGNHREIYSGVTEKAERLPETPFATVAHISKQANHKIGSEQKDQPEYIVPDREQQPHNIGNERSCKNLQAIHNPKSLSSISNLSATGSKSESKH